MSISASIANALTGLTASARSAEVTSANVSNALTDGYGRRQIVLSADRVSGLGAGVRVTDVLRNVDRYVIGERRLADAAMARIDTRANFYERLGIQVGAPDEPGSLTGRIDALEAALIQAASRPDSNVRLEAVSEAAARLASHINGVADGIQGLRMEADQDIARQVDALNTGLQQIHELNVKIRSKITAGGQANTLMDQRQVAIDALSEIVPVRIADRQHGQVALYTSGWAILLDGLPPDIQFTQVGIITADMTVASGALNELVIDGRTVQTGAGGRLGGGSLGAAFEVRDVEAVEAQANLDAIARDLVERFADPALDPSLNPGDAGLFTDAGGAFIAANEEGLANRLQINPAVDPQNGGAAWRIRDGIAAAAPGNVGDATLIQALADRIAQSRIPASGPFAGTARTTSGLSGEFLTEFNARLKATQIDFAFEAAHRDTLKTRELEMGVDTDYEMQQLLLIEQAYAANARVISAADQMLDQLLRL